MDTEIHITDGKDSISYNFHKMPGIKYLQVCKIEDYSTWRIESAIHFIKQFIEMAQSGEYSYEKVGYPSMEINDDDLSELKRMLLIMEQSKKIREASLTLENAKIRELELKIKDRNELRSAIEKMFDGELPPYKNPFQFSFYIG